MILAPQRVLLTGNHRLSYSKEAQTGKHKKNYEDAHIEEVEYVVLPVAVQNRSTAYPWRLLQHTDQ